MSGIEASVIAWVVLNDGAVGKKEVARAKEAVRQEEWPAKAVKHNCQGR
jgi:hypothetical protein